jgi:hypothetical protein
VLFPPLLDGESRDLVRPREKVESEPVPVGVDECLPVSSRDALGVPLARRVLSDGQKFADRLPADPLHDLSWGPDVLHAAQDGELISHLQENVSRDQVVNLCKNFPLLHGFGEVS